MLIYKMSRILRVTVKCTVINTTANTPAEVVLVTLPFSDYSKTIDQVKQYPEAKIAYLSGSGGIDKAIVSKTDTLTRSLGFNSGMVRDYQQSSAEAASTLALLPDTPVIALYVGGAATEPTLRVFIEVTYHIDFFELEHPGSVTVQVDHQTIDMTRKKDATYLSPTPVPKIRRPLSRHSEEWSGDDMIVPKGTEDRFKPRQLKR